MIKLGLPDNEVPIALESISATYLQNNDSAISNGLQSLKVFTQDAGGGSYFVIETERWAFDSIEELILLLTDFKLKIEK